VKTRHLQTGDVRPGRLFRIPDAPDNVMFDLTWACNQRCVFCYNPREQRRRSHPSPDTAHAIVRKLAEWGVQEVLYLGGEPTLHPDFRGVIELGTSLGLVQRIVTNGSRVDEQLAGFLAANNVEAGVSLHGTRPELHDRLTAREGAFDRATRAIDALLSAGVGTFVQYSPTRLDGEGLPTLASMLRERYRMGIRFIDVNRLLPYGEGADAERSCVVDEDGWWRVFRDVADLVLDGWRLRVESVPRCWIRSRAKADGLEESSVDAILQCLRPCWMGVNQLAFDPAGHIKLCPGGPPVGASILDVDPPGLWRSDPQILRRRLFSFLPRECVDYEYKLLCSEFYICCGGCRVAAGSPSGAPDPSFLSLRDS